MTSPAKVRGSRLGRVHLLARADGLKRVTACGRTGYQTSVDSEIETVRDIRLEITSSPRLVTCGQCKASLSRDAREKVKAAQGEGK